MRVIFPFSFQTFGIACIYITQVASVDAWKRRQIQKSKRDTLLVKRRLWLQATPL
jgi:hypothetical protein